MMDGTKQTKFILMGLILLTGVLLTCGCIETQTRTVSIGPTNFHVTAIEHTSLYGEDGFFTKTYDIQVLLFGVTIAEATKISRSRMQDILKTPERKFPQIDSE